MYHINQEQLTIVNIWEDIIAGTAAGTMSGIIISISLWLIDHLRKPKFEYFHIAGEIAHFQYNRHRPIVIGGSHAHCHGPGLFERSPRGAHFGIYIGPMENHVFSTSQCATPLMPGDLIEIVYCYAPFRFLWNQEARQRSTLYAMDPLELHGTRSDSANHEPQTTARSRQKTKHNWKSYNCILKPVASR